MLNYLKQDEETAKRAYHEVDSFHDLIMGMAEQFARAYELGMDSTKRKSRKTGRTKGNQRGGHGTNRQNDTGGDGNKTDGSDANNADAGATSKLKPCVWCNGMHLLKKCPTLPERMKEWPWWKVLKERKKNERASEKDKSGGPRNVRFKKTGSEGETVDPGGETIAPKKRLATKVTKALQEENAGAVEKSWAEAGQIGADGTATVGGVSGFYKADGGCDKTTCRTHFAKRLEKAGVEIHKYDRPRPAKLADGSVKDLIIGYCVADIELVTRAGPVVLARNHIDILDGPETENLLYIGEAEERRLKLKSYAQQLEELAKKRGNLKRKKSELDQKVASGAKTFLKPNPDENERGKRAWGKAALNSKPVISDGMACLGQHNWKVLRRTPYIFEPLAKECYYITSAALQVSGVSMKRTLPKNGVAIFDLDRNVKDWLGIKSCLNGKYVAKVDLPLRVFPHSNPDTVRRLTKVDGVECRVINSDTPALVIGGAAYEHLLERRDEAIGLWDGKVIDWVGIEHRLDEMLDAARVEGMSAEGLKVGAHLVKKKARNIWRLKLQPGDVADLPPLKIELEGDAEFKLPKPYRRRYTPAETAWWNRRIKKLLKVGVIRPSSSGQLSPSNLVPKKLDGIILTDDFHMIIDMRGTN